MTFQVEALEEALRTLGSVLEESGLSYGILVIGGSGLLLLGLIERPTGDLDVIGLAENGHYRKAESLPEPLAGAARRVGRALDLAENWLNTDPAFLMDLGLPAGWEERIAVRRFAALEVHLPSRFDQVCFKLYAAVDRGPHDKHFRDLQDLEPTKEELITAARWTRTHDPSEGFQQELRGCLADFGVNADDPDL